MVSIAKCRRATTRRQIQGHVATNTRLQQVRDTALQESLPALWQITTRALLDTLTDSPACKIFSTPPCPPNGTVISIPIYANSHVWKAGFWHFLAPPCHDLSSLYAMGRSLNRDALIEIMKTCMSPPLSPKAPIRLVSPKSSSATVITVSAQTLKPKLLLHRRLRTTEKPTAKPIVKPTCHNILPMNQSQIIWAVDTLSHFFHLKFLPYTVLGSLS